MAFPMDHVRAIASPTRFELQTVGAHFLQLSKLEFPEFPTVKISDWHECKVSAVILRSLLSRHVCQQLLFSYSDPSVLCILLINCDCF